MNKKHGSSSPKNSFSVAQRVLVVWAKILLGGLTNIAMATTSSVKELSKEELNTILNAVPALRNDFNLLITSLKRRQLSGSQQCARATLEVIRSLVSDATLGFSSCPLKLTHSYCFILDWSF